MSNDITAFENTSFLSAGNFEHAFRIANMLSKSEMVPKGYKDKPQDILIAMEMGRNLGLGPLQAIQNIAVFNGKPCLYGDGILAVCSGRKDFENIVEAAILDDDEKVIGYSCTIKRLNRSPVTHIFTVEHAIAASLWGKAGPWKQYPERMLQMRARGFALRDSFADALGGIKVLEEVEDYQDYRVKKESTAAELKGFITNLIKNNPSLDKGTIDTGEILDDVEEL